MAAKRQPVRTFFRILSNCSKLLERLAQRGKKLGDMQPIGKGMVDEQRNGKRGLPTLRVVLAPGDAGIAVCRDGRGLGQCRIVQLGNGREEEQIERLLAVVERPVLPRSLLPPPGLG